MAIKEINKNNKTFFQVYSSVRSRQDPSIRVQKMKTNISSRSEAEKIERELIREIHKDLIEREQSTSSWERLIKEYESVLSGDQGFNYSISRSTKTDYIQLLKDYTIEWMDLSVKNISRAHAIEVLRKVVDEHGKSMSTRDRLRSAINSVFNWAIENRAIEGVISSPAIGIKFYERREEKIPEILTLSEIKKLLEHAHQLSNPWLPIWSVAIHTGLRNGELYALTWNNVDFENKLIHVHRSYNKRYREVGPTKGRYWRDVPINEELERILKELKAASKSDCVLPRVSSWNKGEQARELRMFCESNGLPSIKFHTLRACFATQLIRQGVAPAVVMKIGGWKTLKSMQRYIRVAGLEIKGATNGLEFMPES